MVYRITRARFYEDPNCLGYADLTAREGHFALGEKAATAALDFLTRNPEVEEWEPLDVESLAAGHVGTFRGTYLRPFGVANE